jgi:hypothetical protein
MTTVLIAIAVPLAIVGAFVLAAVAYSLWWVFLKPWPRKPYR